MCKTQRKQKSKQTALFCFHVKAATSAPLRTAKNTQRYKLASQPMTFRL